MSEYQGQPLRVLIVEDSPEVVGMLRPVLTGDGHEVEVASDGETGLDLAAKFDPEVVLLDVVLPGVDGVEVCRGRARTW